MMQGQGGLLLKYRLKALANGFKGIGFKKAMRPISILTLGMLFVIGDYWFFHRVIVYLDGLPFRVGDELIIQLINLVFITLFMMVLFSSLIVSLSVYYLSHDLELLHSLPISISGIVTSRYFSAWETAPGWFYYFPYPCLLHTVRISRFHGIIICI